MTTANSDVKRVIVSLTDRDDTNLRIVMECTGMNGTDSIRQALTTEVWLQRVLASGGKLLVRHADGNIREVSFATDSRNAQ